MWITKPKSFIEVLLMLEQLGVFAISLYLYSLTGFSWWLYLLLWIVPDVGMVGYLINPRIGSYTYNITHWQLVGWVAAVAGIWLGSQILIVAGAIVLGHSSCDRLLGLGLKYPDGFKHTHLS